MRASQQYNQLQLKQSYVYQNILQSDHDIQTFAQFLASQPPKYSSNLEEITFETVKSSVDAFVLKNSKKERQSNCNSVKMAQSKMGRFSVDFNQNEFYVRTKECVKQINKFALTSIALNIVSYRKNQGGFLSRDFITFKIQLPQLHKHIERRYSDFEWLSGVLGYYHPGVVIPPLAKKKLKKIFTDDHLKKKGRMLQNFLRKCLQVPDLRNDENLYRFLSIQKAQKFQQYKKLNYLQRGMLAVQKIKSSTGTIQYGITEQSLSVNRKGIEYFKKLPPMMKQLYKQVKRVQQSLGACSVHLQNLQAITKKLVPLQEQFRRDCGKRQSYEQDCEREKSFLQNLAVVAEKYKQQLKAMKQVWEKDLYMKVKYQFHHSQAFVEFMSQYEAKQKDFYSIKQSLKKKKLKIYSRPMNEWGVPQQKILEFQSQKPSYNQVSPFLLPKKTQQLAAYQFSYALQTRQLYNSVVHYARFNNIYNMKSLEKFLQKQHAIQQQWSDKLRNVITNQFQFSITQASSINDKLINKGSSIKGFFSQFTENNTEKSKDEGFKSAIQLNESKEVQGVFYGM